MHHKTIKFRKCRQDVDPYMSKRLTFFANFGAVQKCVNFVHLERCCKMNVYFQQSALMQPRTSPEKSHIYFLLILRIRATKIINQGLQGQIVINSTELRREECASVLLPRPFFPRRPAASSKKKRASLPSQLADSVVLFSKEKLLGT